MKRIASPFALAAALALAVSGPLAAASDDALSLVPPDAAAVGLLRVADFRMSPIFDRVFSETDRISGDADAARFLEEVRLDPKQDVDVVVFAGSPRGAGPGGGGGFAAFEGRFDAAALAAATASRGGVKKSVAGGDYYLLPERRRGRAGRDGGAVAFLSDRLIVAGNEAAVVAALGRRAAGGGGFASNEGLGASLARIDPRASAWALVDMARMPAKVHARERRGGDGPEAILGAMASVSLVALSATADGDALKLSATGVTADAETRQNLEDAIRGLLAMWRMAVQEKQPDLLPVLRAFKVSQGTDSVTVSGTLPASVLRDLQPRKERASR
jgi:hypothetical protein